MFKKILAFVLLSLIISCGSSRPKIQTTKNGTVKNRTTRKTVKPHVKTPTASSGSSSTSTGGGRSTETLQSTSKTVVYSDQVRDYVTTYDYIAKSNMKKYGIPASIILAQGILESGAGRGTLCTNANNHFGIKCHNDWTGEKVYHDDDSEQECFRKYKLAAESFDDHSTFLTTRGRYANLFKLDKDDYEGWARGLRAAGYATDPRYPEKLIGLIERFDLAKYDAEVLDKNYTPKPKTTPAPKVTVPAPVIVSSKPAPSIQQASQQSPASTTGFYTVSKGDTLYSISKKHNITVDKLMELNELSNNAISIGQVLKVK